MVMNAGEQYKSGRRIRTLCREGQRRQKNSMGIRTKAVKNVMYLSFFVINYRNRTKEHNKGLMVSRLIIMSKTQGIPFCEQLLVCLFSYLFQ